MAQPIHQNDNPYAAPRANVEFFAEGRCWRLKKTVFVARESDLPQRCIRCNAEAELPVRKRRIYWHASGWYLLVLLNIILYAIVAMIVRKRADVRPGLCTVHRKRRTLWLSVWTVALVVGVVAGFIAISEEAPPLAVLAAVVVLAAIIALARMSRLVYPTKITPEYVGLKGFGAPFLDSLPNERVGD